jgi:long-chain acyl-CoA synthetase
MVDQALILLALPARFRNNLAIAMEGERLWGWRHPAKGESRFNRMVGLLEYVLVVWLFNVFPLPQKSGFRRSFSFAGDCVDRGQSVLVFPEGRRTQNGQMDRFMDGIGLLARGLEVPVIPMRIAGLYEMKARRKYFAHRGLIRVFVGDPITPGLNDEPSCVARELEQAVRSLGDVSRTAG